MMREVSHVWQRHLNDVYIFLNFFPGVVSILNQKDLWENLRTSWKI